MVLVTNYKKGLKGVPVESVMPDKRISFDKDSMELTINETLTIGVFDLIPYMRKTNNNKGWFEIDIYHLR